MFCNISQEKLYLDKNGDIGADLNIKSWVPLSTETIHIMTMGSLKRERLTINQDGISELELKKVWKILASFHCLIMSRETLGGHIVIRVHFNWTRTGHHDGWPTVGDEYSTGHGK